MPLVLGGGVDCAPPEDTSRRVPCEQPLCVADPTPRLVCVDTCRDDADCPGGTVCGLRLGIDEPVCTPPLGPHAPSNALTEGFGARQMASSLTLVELPSADGSVRVSAELAWVAPADTEWVTCALFSCPPVVEDGRIVNYDACVMARLVSQQREGSFSLTDIEREYSAPPADGCEEGRDPDVDTQGLFPVTELLVGCWAYDDTQLVAATRLQRPAAAAIADFHRSFDLACSGEDAPDRNCLLDDGTFGSCVAGQCRRRCLRDADCGDETSRGAPGSCRLTLRTGSFSICEEDEPERSGRAAAPAGGELVTEETR